jgi:predicted small secreted protein
MFKFYLKLFVASATLVLAGCGTVGGAVSGAGTDLQRAGDWIKTR